MEAARPGSFFSGRRSYCKSVPPHSAPTAEQKGVTPTLQGDPFKTSFPQLRGVEWAGGGREGIHIYF